MKAVEIKKTGGPEVLEVKDISLDKPGPDQVSIEQKAIGLNYIDTCLLYTSPSPRDATLSRMPSSA